MRIKSKIRLALIACPLAVVSWASQVQASDGTVADPGAATAPTINSTVSAGCDSTLTLAARNAQQTAVQNEYYANHRPPPPTLGSLSCLSSLLNTGSGLFSQIPSLSSIISQIESQACASLTTMWSNTLGSVSGSSGYSYNIGSVQGVNIGNVGVSRSGSADSSVGLFNDASSSLKDSAKTAAQSIFGTGSN